MARQDRSWVQAGGAGAQPYRLEEGRGLVPFRTVVAFVRPGDGPHEMRRTPDFADKVLQVLEGVHDRAEQEFGHGLLKPGRLLHGLREVE